jgi:NAD(P)-dependent dehydrogenase (short-subunit alcohol dehydrogenase family)
MSQTRLFTGKVAVVTGGNAGIGRAIALAFADAGATVVIAARRAAAGADTVRHIATHGGQAQFIATDVTHARSVETLMTAVSETYGRIDYLCNNAGFEGRVALTHETTPADWDAVIAVNLTGVWLAMQHALKYMLEQRHGTIVNVSSSFGLVGFPGLSAYTASKHGVIGLTKAAAREYAPSNIRINAVCPGAILTPMRTRLNADTPDAAARVAARYPMGRIGVPDEVAKAVVWLCSDAASFITGHVMTVDGGFTAQ